MNPLHTLSVWMFKSTHKLITLFLISSSDIPLCREFINVVKIILHIIHILVLELAEKDLQSEF